MNRTTLVAVLTIAIISILSLTAQGQDKVKTTGFVEIQGQVKQGSTTPQLNIDIERPITKRVGTFGWVLVTKGYSESYGGVTFSPTSNFTVAMGPGIEVYGGKVHSRLGGYIYYGHKRFSSFTAIEALGSGKWIKSTNNFKVGKGVKVGVVAQSFKGVAPHVEYDIPQTSLKVWGSVFINRGNPIAVFGLRYNFKF